MSGQDDIFHMTRILANQAQTCLVCTVRYYPVLDSADYDSRIYCSLACRQRVGELGKEFPEVLKEQIDDMVYEHMIKPAILGGSAYFMDAEKIQKAKQRLREEAPPPVETYQDIVSPEYEDAYLEMRKLPEISDEQAQEDLDLLFPPVSVMLESPRIYDFKPGSVYAVEGLNPKKSEAKVVPHVVLRRIARWIGELRDLLGSWARRWCTQWDCYCGGCE